MVAIARRCRQCDWWRSFEDVYEDPEEPDHIGFCEDPDPVGDEVRQDCETCEHWKVIE